IGGADPLPYPKRKIRMRHYGRNLESLVAKTKDIPEDKRKGMAEVVANYMKLCYANWSKDHVSDESIRQDLETLSKGLLERDKDYAFSDIAPARPQEFRAGGKKGFHKKKNRNFKGKNFQRRR